MNGTIDTEAAVSLISRSFFPGETCHEKYGPPKMVPPGTNISKYLDPRSIWTDCEIFGPLVNVYGINSVRSVFTQLEYRYTYNVVVETHCYALQCWQIDCEQIRI